MRVGSLCSGYEGLGMAVEAVFPDAELAWVSDIDKGACKVLAHRFPDVPNIGDMTKVDWAGVEPVDVITGGTPCQDLSHAGKRAGMTEGTRSNLWVAMREAIAQLRPSLVIWENVGGAYSAAADSEMESRAGRVGDRPGGPVLRALGRVLGDLASLGYVGGWHGLRAADVGAPHGRLRVFVVAVHADTEGYPWGFLDRDGLAAADDDRGGREVITQLDRDPAQTAADRTARRGHPRPTTRLLKTPTSQLAINGGSQHPDKRKAGGHGPTLADEVEHLLPTPACNDMGEGKTPETWDAWTDDMKARHGNGNGHGKSLSIEAQRLNQWVDETPADYIPPYTRDDADILGDPCPECGCEWGVHDAGGFCAGPCGGNRCNGRQFLAQQRLLPTPSAQEPGYVGPLVDGEGNPATDVMQRVYDPTTGRLVQTGLNQFIQHTSDWGDYAAAIARWEHTLQRPAPAPTMTSSKGNPQLSPRFTEWLMGLPDGWITDVPGIARNEALKLCGNGVVPQQAEAAIRFLLGVISSEVAA